MDGSGHAGLAPDEAISLERHDHLVNRWRADLKVTLHIGFGGVGVLVSANSSFLKFWKHDISSMWSARGSLPKGIRRQIWMS